MKKGFTKPNITLGSENEKLVIQKVIQYKNGVQKISSDT